MSVPVHDRRSIRLPGWDYRRGGAYFVTICTGGRLCIFGDIVDERMEPNPAGEAVERCWRRLSRRATGVRADDTFVVMPNHVHGIVWLDPPEGTDRGPETGSGPRVPKGSLGAVVRTFKSYSARHIHRLPGHAGMDVWQRNYYETIVRSDVHLERVRRYILDNPRRWAMDPPNPSYRRPVGGRPTWGDG